MPLIHSGSPQAKSENIKREMAAGKPQRQAVAIALDVARRSRADGGRVAAEKVLPPDHKLGMKVPKGGSMCANCRFLASPNTCGNPGFIKWNGGAKLPEPDDEYCCDLWGPRG